MVGGGEEEEQAEQQAQREDGGGVGRTLGFHEVRRVHRLAGALASAGVEFVRPGKSAGELAQAETLARWRTGPEVGLAVSMQS
ncbi:hypothetical protein LBMAG56_05160 [Verrucomicrobiota bacterium]|nr:hypothetical protein LBMAG56_05160 [Verrucomicrobiota bacterium]